MSSTERIEHLTDEQLAQLPLFRERWLRIGLSTEPGDHAAAERAIADAYRVAGLAPPAQVLWLSSPLHGALLTAGIATQIRTEVDAQVWGQVRTQVDTRVRDQLWKQVDAQVWGQVWNQAVDQVRAQVQAQVRAQVDAQVDAQVWALVTARVRDQVWKQVNTRVRDQVWDQVRAQVDTRVRDQVRDQLWAQFDTQVRAPVADQVRAQVQAQVRAQVDAQVWARVRDQVWDRVRDQVWNRVWDQVRDEMRAPVGVPVAAQVRDQFWDQVGARVATHVCDEVRDQIELEVNGCGYGLHDANWLSFYDVFKSFGLRICNQFQPLMDLAQHAGWWWPFRDLCIMTEKPSSLRRDDRQRLHAADGPAIDYDGTWSIYAWHGVRVPDWIITRPVAELTAAEIFGVENVEQRRALIERIGTEAFCRIVQPTVLHADLAGNGTPRRLLAVDLPDDPDGQLVAVEVVCPSTSRIHHLRVPPTMRTCQEAIAWTFPIGSRDYALLIET